MSIEVTDLASEVAVLRAAAVNFRTEGLVRGPGGSQSHHRGPVWESDRALSAASLGQARPNSVLPRSSVLARC